MWSAVAGFMKLKRNSLLSKPVVNWNDKDAVFITVGHAEVWKVMAEGESRYRDRMREEYGIPQHLRIEIHVDLGSMSYRDYVRIIRT